MGVPAASVTYARLLALIAEAGGVTVSATAPTDPETGNLWYDTTYQLLKIYDGGDWHTLLFIIISCFKNLIIIFVK